MNQIHFNKILCFGEVLWDMLPGGKQPGGAPMNVAIHLKKQGLDPILVSRIGIDAEGERLKYFLKKADLNLSFLQEDITLPTSKVMVQIKEDGNAGYEIYEPVAWDNLQYLIDLENFALDADLIIFGTLASRNSITRKTLMHLLENSQAKRFLDINLRPPFDEMTLVESLLFKADFVKLNDDELRVVAGWNQKSGTEKELVMWLANHYNCKLICETRGANGALLYADNKFYTHAGYKVDAVDTVGAGDAFLAGLIASYSKGLSQGKALEYAVATGAFVASGKGAVPDYSPEDIERIIG